MGKRIANPAKVEANAQSIAAVQDGLAYIVGNTNTTGSTLAVGQFVYVKGHSTIDEGLRKVTASISANANITTSNTSACSEGGLNALNSKLTNVWTDITSLCTWNTTYVSNYAAYYNAVAKQVFCKGIVTNGTPNQTTLVTLNKTILFEQYLTHFVDLNSNPAITIDIIAKNNTIKSSHSRAQANASAYTFGGVVAVSD